MTAWKSLPVSRNGGTQDWSVFSITQLRGRQPLVLYASHADFEQTNTIQGQIGEGTGGVTEALRRRIILPLGGPIADTDHVLGHELVHAFQFDITRNEHTPPEATGALRLPLWFIEGMAEYLSVGTVDPNTAMWLRDAARGDAMPTIDQLDNPKYFPYRWGHAFWAYVAGRWGDQVVPRMLAAAAEASDPAVAIQRVLGVTPAELSQEWQASIRRTYAAVLAATTAPTDVGQALVKKEKLGGEVNVGPAISPDGKWIAFFSERGLFSIDLYVAQVSTGRVLRKLTSSATDPHYMSLQFISSAGAWDAESTRIAIATVTGGRAALAIFNAQSGDREREIRIPDADEIFNPTWAPDGHAICFTGMTKGLTDLFIVDVESGSVRQLTSDAFADLQPAWSPDGSRIAFVTDRFSSTIETLNMGSYRIALLDPQTGRIEQAPAFTRGKNINPQWMPGSRSILFISDGDGIPNLYRLSLAEAAIFQVTSVATGLSGITNTSPALSVASRAGLAAFSVYDGGSYEIYTRPTDGLGEMRVDPSDLRSELPETAATLPPLDRRPSDVQALLANASFGLPPAQQYETAEYRPRLSIESVGQPTIEIGASRLGAAVGGGIGFQFSDMLGDHSLWAAIQINAGTDTSFSLKNTAAQVMYLNQEHRWNWGVISGQIPYLSGSAQEGIAIVNGEPSLVDRTITFRQTERSIAAITAYPFNRAQRVEFQSGFTETSFDQIVHTQAHSLNTGQRILDQTDTTSAAASLNLWTTSGALVLDTSVFGATSPIHGQRYRLEASPTLGSLAFVSTLIDYRRYFMPVRFYTVAVRGMHYGRYGSNSDDRLYPLSIGYPNLVRGYDLNTIEPSECTPNAASPCPQYDRLLGSRMLVGNIELRFPLLRPFGVSQNMYGPLPIEVALFADGGVAYDHGESPTFLGGSRQSVSSLGVTLRANLFGFAIGQFHFARPLQRTGRGWVFEFNLSPGY